jgi:hypothetical protein
MVSSFAARDQEFRQKGTGLVYALNAGYALLFLAILVLRRANRGSAQPLITRYLMG